jgi:hypothetical protein
MLSGTELAAGIRAEVAAAAADLTAAGTPPRLAVVVATADESSAWYVRSIARAAEKTGIACSVVDLGEMATPNRILAELATLSGSRPACPPSRRPRPRPCSRCWTTTGSPCPARTPSWSGAPTSSGSPRLICCCSGTPP